MRPLVVAIGNPFMRDDGVGQAILDELERDGVDADLIDLGTDLFRLTRHSKGRRTIIIADAFRGGGAPGDVLSFSGEGLCRELDSRIRSAHLIGSIEVIEVLREVDPCLSEADIHMVGVVVKDISTGEGLSREVRSSVPEAARKVREMLTLTGP